MTSRAQLLRLWSLRSISWLITDTDRGLIVYSIPAILYFIPFTRGCGFSNELLPFVALYEVMYCTTLSQSYSRVVMSA